ncbi:Detected protein of confused Function [Hibiscus syriacus]|uniref:Detected protein of confused Function n=1 Tax=Hibiscus syriacus TaxID=106335 RepID=A0A6A3CJX7_HIBSY|nr:Detected protein of confused Function [Hibiscus syriacus]
MSTSLKTARDKFTREISFHSKDEDVSLAKALLYAAAEDEAFMAYNQEMDSRSLLNERMNVSFSSDTKERATVEQMSLGGKIISEWLINVVLFELRDFKRTPVLVDSKHSYLHSVLSSGCGSGVLQRDSGHSLFAVVNGRCVEDSRSMASDLTGTSLLGLEIATNRDIIGISLANLIRLHWKRASRSNPGLMLTSSLSQSHNWSLRRDHGMMLSYNREYGKGVQEHSICMALAPEEEAEILQPFVHKLHLTRLESSWETLGHTPPLTIK